MAKAPVGTKVIALQDFFSEELGSQYVKGLIYTVHDEAHGKLAELIPRWISQGRVKIIEQRAPGQAQPASMAGKGEVR